MGLFSFLRKKQQESSVGNSDFYSQADEEQPSGRSRRKQSNKRTEAVDPVLPEKKRARRRLIGAIALVLAAVIGLPMILDSEPKPLSDDINIQIPSKDTAAPIAQSKAPTTQKNSQPTAESLSPDEEVLEAPASQVAAKTEVKPEEKPEVKAVEPEKKPQVAKVETPEHKVATPPTIAKTDHSDEAARARAILDGKANTAAPKASGKIVLQVAALATQDKVNELQKKLQGAGLKSFTQKVATESGERIRVRVGPFANEAEAEKARAKLTKLGLTGKQVPA
ncbi:MAG: SPOR domain-containing protein [Herminiimonas sp.]|uniref:SPOR domain-containing protein n=1 Tax=Herminiimonas sp. TaxID=1926289 RepID=UPI002720EDF8|nr:SPOR domain-containing protein [Herminiimonas sp.]MDO9419694.1 SPOR domain-containing protein [Herminiimonas sp.]